MPERSVGAFTSELERRGYVFGKTLEIETGWWDESQPDAAGALAGRDWDVVVAGGGNVALAVHRASRTIPIVIAGSDLDPVAAGLAVSRQEPMRNVSGTTLTAPGLNEALVTLLGHAVPHITRVAVLANPDNVDHSRWLTGLASVGGVSVRRLDVRPDTDLDEAFRRIDGEGGGGLVVLPDPELRRRRDAIVSLALREGLPTIASEVGFADAGGLFAYHPALDASWRDAAEFVDRVLKGAAIGSLAIRTVEERDFVVNLATAETLGLELRGGVTLSATRVIQGGAR